MQKNLPISLLPRSHPTSRKGFDPRVLASRFEPRPTSPSDRRPTRPRAGAAWASSQTNYTRAVLRYRLVPGAGWRARRGRGRNWDRRSCRWCGFRWWRRAGWRRLGCRRFLRWCRGAGGTRGWSWSLRWAVWVFFESCCGGARRRRGLRAVWLRFVCACGLGLLGGLRGVSRGMG